MTLQDLQDALARLASDPRVHPTTKLEIGYRVWDAEAGMWDRETMPLCHLVLATDHTLRFSTDPDEPALVR